MKSTEPIKSIEIFAETDYSKFNRVVGNRTIDKNHVAYLVKQFAEHGNFTENDPIEVDQDMNVLDGQHRLAALEKLNWPVFYRIAVHKDIDDIRAANVGRRNWTWYDVAVSYSDLGNEHYTKFLDLKSKYNLTFTTALLFTDDPAKARDNKRAFFHGKFSIKDIQSTTRYIQYFAAMIDASGVDNSYFARAAYKLFVSANYDHNHMVAQLNRYAISLYPLRTQIEFYKTLADIYNLGLSESEKINLY